MAYMRRRNPGSRIFGCLLGLIAMIFMLIVITTTIAIAFIVDGDSSDSGQESHGDSPSSNAPASGGHWSNGS